MLNFKYCKIRLG